MGAYLAFSMATNFDPTCHTGNPGGGLGSPSNAKESAQFFTPQIPSGYFGIGDYGHGFIDIIDNKPFVFGSVLVVRAVDDDPNNPLLKPAASYNAIFSRSFTANQATKGFVFWYPVPPPGYVSIGSLTSMPGNPPNGAASYRCIRADQVTSGTFSSVPIWNSNGVESDNTKLSATIYTLGTTGVIYGWPGPQKKDNPPIATPTSPIWQPIGFPANS